MTCEGMNTITKKLQEADDDGNSEWKIFRNFVINMVLGTDMNNHPETLAHLKTLTELKLITTNELGLDKPQDRLMILKNVLHCADLGNPTKKTKTYTWWADQVMKEFYAQGDAEKLRQMTVSRGFDRNDSNMASMQIGFIDYRMLGGERSGVLAFLGVFGVFSRFSEFSAFLGGFSAFSAFFSVFQRFSEFSAHSAYFSIFNVVSVVKPDF